MRWATSDHHWGHHNILRYCAETRSVFPSVDEMNAVLVARWNERVAPDDEVLLVGDAFCSRRMPREMKVGILRMLHGKKTLVRGNHDDQIDIFHEAGFVSIVEQLELPGGILVIHRPPDREYGREEWETARGLQPSLIVHGHTHALGAEAPRCFNVCVDRHDFYPVPWTRVEERLQEAVGEAPDWAHQITPESPHTTGQV